MKMTNLTIRRSITVKKGANPDEYYYEDNRGYKGGKGKGYRANRAQEGDERKVRLDKKKRDADAEGKEQQQACEKVEAVNETEQDTVKQEKVVEKAEQESMEKPANISVETAETGDSKQHAKQTGAVKKESEASEPSGFVNSFKPVEVTSDTKVDTKLADNPSTTHDNIAPITSAPTVITLDNPSTTHDNIAPITSAPT